MGLDSEKKSQRGALSIAQQRSKARHRSAARVSQFDHPIEKIFRKDILSSIVFFVIAQPNF